MPSWHALIDMHCRLGEEPIDGHLLPALERQLQLRRCFRIVASEITWPMRVWIKCCTRFREIIWAISRFSTYALMPAPYCTGPEKVSGNGARVSLAQCGQHVISASRWLSTFSKTMSIWVRRS